MKTTTNTEIPTNKTCRCCGGSFPLTDLSPSRLERCDYLCMTCRSSSLQELRLLGKSPTTTRAGRIHSRGARRGAVEVCGVTQSDFRAIAQEYNALSENYPEEDYEVDHIIPISQGGCNCPQNVQVLTREQHAAKTKAEFRMPCLSL